ncbi:uncharacterized protein PGTG_04188 [Puccinia graminis f. sp. tritici CRL 75-36-700-3]|uniref:Uncharacterized protein n=1 Tax=Puccinia graminis f. sp. tritici (strain CRL 75-36-700-3 / race SCCL) TaxID=418459 RepID=E3K1Q7_PUCGT|nr:uncharacterized protein PGTG_04188 [Puccinia graminis f. sp. tritici CRL 75-36-700-3]EFP78232.1 hypothetical protein PGTG_04188 [Puccinia graminis f. sp. tritici CRL 75-36-700-3]
MADTTNPTGPTGSATAQNVATEVGIIRQPCLSPTPSESPGRREETSDPNPDPNQRGHTPNTTGRRDSVNSRESTGLEIITKTHANNPTNDEVFHWLPIEERFERYYYRMAENRAWLDRVNNQSTEEAIRAHLNYCREDFSEMIALRGRDNALIRTRGWDPSSIPASHYLNPIANPRPRDNTQRGLPAERTVDNNRNINENRNQANPPNPHIRNRAQRVEEENIHHQVNPQVERRHTMRDPPRHRQDHEDNRERFQGPIRTRAPRRNCKWRTSIYSEMVRIGRSLQGTYQHLEEGRIRTQRGNQNAPPENHRDNQQGW